MHSGICLPVVSIYFISFQFWTCMLRLVLSCCMFCTVVSFVCHEESAQYVLLCSKQRFSSAFFGILTLRPPPPILFLVKACQMTKTPTNVVLFLDKHPTLLHAGAAAKQRGVPEIRGDEKGPKVSSPDVLFRDKSTIASAERNNRTSEFR